MNTVKDDIENSPEVEFEPKAEAQPDVDGLNEAEEALLDELAGLSPVLYARRRSAAAEKLGIGGPALDKEVALRRPHNNGDAGQGRALDLFEPEPWPEPVAGDVLLDRIVETFRRFLILPEHAAEAMALWVVFAHAIDAADVAPRLAITSPVKRCAKTTALNVIGRLVPRALPASNISPAAVFRAIEAARPTLLIDEADTFLKTSDELRGILNSGHTRDSANVVRVVGDNLEVRQFSTWAAIAVALIGRLPDTLEDRSIAIEMKRKKPNETVEKFRRNRLAELADLASMAARWAADNGEALRKATPEIPLELHDRAADNWEPLLAIADIAGGDWPERARIVAVRICDSADDDTSARVQLLKDIGELFKKHDTDQLASATIVSDLGEMEHRPWPDWKAGRPISAPQIARLLKPFGISPKNIRIGDKIPKGYKLAQLDDALPRYGGSQTATPLQINVTAASDDFQTATPDISVAARNVEKPKETADCSGVAAQIEGCGPLDTNQAEAADDEETMEWAG